jgi:hypothetical protein
MTCHVETGADSSGESVIALLATYFIGVVNLQGIIPTIWYRFERMMKSYFMETWGLEQICGVSWVLR